jgi:hypothetical protein
MFLWQLLFGSIALNAGRKDHIGAKPSIRSAAMQSSPLPNPHSDDPFEPLNMEYIVKDAHTLTPVDAKEEHEFDPVDAKEKHEFDPVKKNAKGRGLSSKPRKPAVIRKSKEKIKRSGNSNIAAVRIRILGHSDKNDVVLLDESITWRDTEDILID